jgi:hypothetical protein
MKLSRIVALLLLTTAVSSRDAASQVSVVGGLVHERTSPAGRNYEGFIEVRNDGPVPAAVRVYLTDYHFDAEGRSRFSEAGTTPRSNARWVTLGSHSVRVSPRQSSRITYQVNVPVALQDSTGGSYWSVAMIEVEPEAASPKRAGSVEIRTVVRQGVQLVTHVGQSGSASISFANVMVVADTLGPAVTFDVANDGTRARKLMLSVDLYSEKGELVARMTKSRGLLYPGCSIRQAFSLAALKKGSYRAFVVADAGDDDLFAGQFALKL